MLCPHGKVMYLGNIPDDCPICRSEEKDRKKRRESLLVQESTLQTLLEIKALLNKLLKSYV